MAEDLLVRLGDRIRTLRKRRGWTQAVMAERVGIDRSFLADVERGRRNVSIPILFRISQGIGIRLSQLDGVQIDPKEWWDSHWINDHIAKRVDLPGSNN